MAFVVGKVCPGIKNRTGAYISAFIAAGLGIGVLVAAFLGMLYLFREDLSKEGRRTNTERIQVQCYYAAGFATWGAWLLVSFMMLAGIKTENKRALGMWLVGTAALPIYLIIGIIFFAVVKKTTGWEIAYLVSQGVALVAMIWIWLAIWVYFGEIRLRDKNPDMRENEMMLAGQPFAMMMPPSGSYNPGYGVPGGSMSSIPRSQKSRHTYAPTEVGSVRAAPSLPRQSRLDQYRAQHVEKNPINNSRSRSNSREREGGTTYYRYQYTAEQRYQSSQHGSQGSLGGRPQQPLYSNNQQMSKDSEV